MQSVEQTVYFNKAGEVNTEATLRCAAEYAVKHDVQAIVVATETGNNAFRLHTIATELGYTGRIVAVRYHTGFSEANENLMTDENYRKLAELGIRVHTGTHAFSSITRSFRLKWKGIDIPEIVAETLRLFGRGVKTAVEITVMAADGDLIPDITRDVVAVAGSTSGADAALVVRPAYQNTFLQDLKIRKILCKPSEI